MSSAATAVAAAAPAPKAPETIAGKVQKHVDSLHIKIQKLSEENAALKAQLHELRASNSRIRRIPKKAGAPPSVPAQA